MVSEGCEEPEAAAGPGVVATRPALRNAATPARERSYSSRVRRRPIACPLAKKSSASAVVFDTSGGDMDVTVGDALEGGPELARRVELVGREEGREGGDDDEAAVSSFTDMAEEA